MSFVRVSMFSLHLCKFYGYFNKSKVKKLFVVTFITLFVANARTEKLFSKTTSENPNLSPKLIILLLDGFRWDYYNIHKHHLTGFRQLLENGVQAEYVQPIFPSISLPSWTTIATGLYPDQHNILGNDMLHREDENTHELIFNYKDNSSNLGYWWKWAEPLWTTATKKGHKVYMANWARCDVAFEGILPHEYTGYKHVDESYSLREQLIKATRRFQKGYSLAMIYLPNLDDAGHKYGPDSINILTTLITVDVALQEFLYNLELLGLHKQVNIAITSDHGVTSIKQKDGMIYVKLKDYIEIDDIYKVIGYGAVVQIAVRRKEKTDLIFKQLSMMPGVNVYKKEDIPDELNYKKGQHIQDILLVAQPNHFIVGLGMAKQLQIPLEEKTSKVEPNAGTHGYYNLTDMRTIFFAGGPAFKRGVVHPPISLEDQYQIFTHILNIPPCDHNGTWKNVKDMLT